MGVLCCLLLSQSMVLGERKRGVLSINGSSSSIMDSFMEGEASPFDKDIQPQGFSNSGSTKQVVKSERPTVNETLTTSDITEDRFSKIGVQSKRVSSRSRRERSRRMSFSQMVFRMDSK